MSGESDLATRNPRCRLLSLCFIVFSVEDRLRERCSLLLWLGILVSAVSRRLIGGTRRRKGGRTRLVISGFFIRTVVVAVLQFVSRQVVFL